MKRLLSRSIPALTVLLLALPAKAEKLNVSVNVLKACKAADNTATGTADIAFPDYTNIFTDAAPPAETSAALTAYCTKGTTLKITAGGTASGVAGYARKLQNSGATDSISYKLALTSGGADLPIGATASTISSLGRSGTPVSFFATLNLAAATADPAADSYSDTVDILFEVN